jgi:uncharacterized secreted protein with C-terminal beta-propeller domain
MKTKLILSAICIVSLSSLFVACSDDDNDTTKPVIVINEPEDGGAIKQVACCISTWICLMM